MTDNNSLPAIGGLLISVITLGLVRTRALAREDRINASAATQIEVVEEAQEELIEETTLPQRLDLDNEAFIPERLNNSVESQDVENQNIELNDPVAETPSLWQTASTKIYDLVTWPWRKAVETYTNIKESALTAHRNYVRLRTAADEVIDAAFKLNEALFKFNAVATEIQPTLPPVENVVKGFKSFSAILTVLLFRNTIATAASVAVDTVTAATVIAAKNPTGVATLVAMAPPLLVAYNADQKRVMERQTSVFGKIRDTVASSYADTFAAAKRLVS